MNNFTTNKFYTLSVNTNYLKDSIAVLNKNSNNKAPHVILKNTQKEQCNSFR